MIRKQCVEGMCFDPKLELNLYNGCAVGNLKRTPVNEFLNYEKIYVLKPTEALQRKYLIQLVLKMYYRRINLEDLFPLQMWQLATDG